MGMRRISSKALMCSKILRLTKTPSIMVKKNKLALNRLLKPGGEPLTTKQSYTVIRVTSYIGE